jgi:hypothetical protein
MIHKGERVVTASDNSSGNYGGLNQTLHFNVSGPIDRRTQEQIAAQVGSATQRAMRRNG